MIDLVLFDLDGVLVDTKKIHFEALNEALMEYGYPVISVTEHLTRFDGKTTNDKLDMLGIQGDIKEKIHTHKQSVTYTKLDTIQPNPDITELFVELKRRGMKICVCSNALPMTVDKCLTALELYDYIDSVYTSQDVKNSKPHPEIFWKAMSEWNAYPEYTTIIEDSPLGLSAAWNTNANVVRVSSPDEVNLGLLEEIETIGFKETPKWKDDKLNVLIPMAGEGSRFANAGYTFPKPLIDVNGMPMIQRVIENLNIDANYIFIVRKEHVEQYNIDSMLKIIVPDCTIIQTDGTTEGAADTTLLAKEHINTDSPLFIANCDQYVEWNSSDFMYRMNELNVDGGIVTFESAHPKWSYAKTDGVNMVTEVAEKNPISNEATVGFYYWKRGSDYVKYAEDMIVLNQRVNNEFYVCPVYNNAIRDGRQITTYRVDGMWGLGTPEDLQHYLDNY